jgi:iron complex outermembrane receptor protein
VDVAPSPNIASYFTMDVHLAWHYKNVELSLVGQNLLDNRHPEFQTEIPRNIYGKVTIRF